MFRSMHIYLASFIVLAWAVNLAQAQMTPPPAVTSVFPPGGKRGTTVEVTLQGQNLQGAAGVLFDGGGVTGKLIEGTKMAFTIAPDAPLGLREFRVVTPRGTSNRAFFVIGTYDETLEKEPNNTPQLAQRITTPTVINGTINPAEDEDCFTFHADAGQQVILEVNASRIESTLDSELALADAQGKQLDGNGDAFKFDSFIVHTFKESGENVVRLRDAMYKGAPSAFYRLTIGAVPFITSVFPAGGARGSTVRVSLNGFNLGDAQTTTLALPADAPMGVRDFRLTTPMGPSNALPIVVSNYPEVMEAEPNDAPDKAQSVSLPVVVNGRLDAPNDLDHFSFSAKQGERISFELFGRRINSPIESYLRILDANGNQIADNDDGPGIAPDSRIDFTAPRVGTYTVHVRDLHRRGGSEFTYRLVASPPLPDFTLAVSPYTQNGKEVVPLLVGRGGAAPVVVTAARFGGFNDEIRLEVVGLPQGVTATPTTIGAGRAQATMVVFASADAPLTTVPLIVRGTATVTRLDGKPQAVTKDAIPLETTRNAGNGMRRYNAAFMTLTVTQEPEVKVMPLTPITLKPGGTVDVPVKIVRRADIKGAVTIVPLDLPPGVTAQNKVIQEDKSETTLTLIAPSAAAIGQHRIVIAAQFSVNFFVLYPYTTEPVTLNVQ